MIVVFTVKDPVECEAIMAALNIGNAVMPPPGMNYTAGLTNLDEGQWLCIENIRGSYVIHFLNATDEEAFAFQRKIANQHGAAKTPLRLAFTQAETLTQN